MGELTVEYDHEELLKGSVESITAKLGDMTRAELEALKKAEAATVKPRSSLIDAIAATIAALPAEDAAAGTDDAVDAQAARIAELDGILQTLAVGLRERGLVEAGAEFDMVGVVFITIDASKDRIAELEGLNLTANQEIEDLRKAAAAKAPAAPKPAKAKQMKLLPGVPDEMPEELRVVFVDADNCTLPDLPALVFAGWQFSNDGSGLVLNEGIAFDPGRPLTDVAAAIATSDGKHGLRATLAVPITVGGGKAMSLPAGHLRFAA